MTGTSLFRRSIAVVIGIDRYDHGIPALRSAVADARRVGDILASQHGYEVLAFLDSDATMARLDTLFTKDLPAEVGADDRVCVYFAGHGVALDGDEGPNGYLLPQDARPGVPSTYLQMPKLHDALLALACRHLLVVLDSCFAGAFRWSSTRDIVSLPDVIHQERFDRFVHDPAWQVITSAASDQRALDALSTGTLGSRDTSGPHSPFAVALFDGLAGAADLVPTRKGDGVITATELYLYLEQRLQPETMSLGLRQTPRLWPLRKHDKGEFIFLVPGEVVNLPPAPPLTYQNNPYRGLSSYESHDSGLFFGRDAVVDQLRLRVTASPLTVVAGASGTGKSSVVKAGLLPALAREQGWRLLPVVRLGASPAESLLAAVRSLGVSPLGSAGFAEIRESIRRWLEQNPTQRLVLVIDQLEELVTLLRAPEDRAAILQLLADLIDEHGSRLRVILTVRSDFEPQFSDSALRRHWSAARYVVPPLTQAELRDVIERPASERVLYFEPASLVDDLITEVVQTPGGLPLLSFTLSEMYVRYVNRRSDDRALVLDDYRALGGVIGALRHRANEEYDRFDAAHRITMQRVMLRMVTTASGALARRRVPLTELDFSEPGENERCEHVLDALVAGRLVVRGLEPDGSAYVEPAHDALVSAWDRLIGWLHDADAEPVDLVARRKITQAAAEWKAAPPASKSGLLWRDSVRARLLGRLVRTRAPWLNTTELAFAQRSAARHRFAQITVVAVGCVLAVVAAAAVYQGIQASREATRATNEATRATNEAARAEQQAQAATAARLESDEQARVARQERSRAEAATDTAVQQRNRAETERDRAEDAARLIAATRLVDSDPTSAALILSEVHDFPRQGVKAVAALRAVAEALLTVAIFRGHEGPVNAVAFSPDGTRVVTASDDQTARVWRVDGHGTPIVLRGHSRPVRSAAFSLDGKRIVTASEDGTARVWSADGRGESVSLQGQPGGLRSAIFSPDATMVITLAKSGDDTTARLLRADGTGAPILTMVHGRGVEAAAFSPDGSRIVTTSYDQTVRVWRTDGSPDAVILRGHTSSILTAQFSPDGSRIVTASADKTARVWRSDGTGEPIVLSGHTDLVRTASFSRDGTRIVTASDDNTARVWRADASGQPIVLRHPDPVQSAAFSADGALIATHTYTRTERPNVRIWRADGKGTPVVLHERSFYAPVFSPDSAKIVTAGGDNTARLSWAAPREPIVLIGHAGTVLSAMFSPDGKRVVTASPDRTARIWSADGKGDPIVLQHNEIVESAAFSPDGTRIVTGSADMTARVWSADGRGEPIVLRGHEFPVRGAEFSPDGTRIVTASEDGTARVWPADGRGVPVILRSTDRVFAAAFSPNGKQVIMATGSGFSIWPADGRGEPRVREADNAGYVISTAEFSPDGTQIVTASDKTARVWQTDGQGAPIVLRGHESDVFTARFSPDGTQIVTASRDFTARVWPSDGHSDPLILRGHQNPVWSAAFSPDGKRVVTASIDNTARVWRVDLASLIDLLRASTTACLEPRLRVQTLGETESDARSKFEACERSYDRPVR